MSGVDGNIALQEELDLLSASSRIAADAPRSKDLYRYLAAGLAGESPVADLEAFQRFVRTLMERVGIWWSPDAYAQLPVMTPWCVRDRSCRYDQGPESWGAPRDDGFMRDDNSIIKKLPLPVTISAPAGHPYDGQKPWRGFTACHIWRDIGDDRLAGEDPWLYSFMPNLVWLPTWISALTDRGGSYVEGVLKRTSISLFRDHPVQLGLRPYTKDCWSELPKPGDGPQLNAAAVAEFAADSKFVARRLAYVKKIVGGCESILSTGSLDRKLVCSRYTAGLLHLEHDAIATFKDSMQSYAAAAAQADG